jgi:signal-transduction protein with cAMP-binding, CBS, and nucleotidyltransferase domain
MKITAGQIRQRACGTVAKGDGTMHSGTMSEQRDVAMPRPIAELLAGPPTVGSMLNASAECIEFDAGDVIFHQNDICQGLYVVISGYMLRKAARLDSRLTLGTVRAGELVELAAMLGDVRHTYTLVAQSKGTAMRLPKEALQRAFQLYPPLRMQLLEELAREVSKAYAICGVTRQSGMRRRPAGTEQSEKSRHLSESKHHGPGSLL